MATIDEVARLELIGAKILVRKCVWTDDLIVIPETLQEHTSWCEILKVGPGCRYFQDEHVGAFVKLPSRDEGIRWLGPESDEAFVVREESVKLLGVLVDECQG